MTALIIRDPGRRKDHSVLLRIATNYFQILSLIRGLKLQWPQRFLDFYTSVASLQTAQEDIF